MSIFCRPNWLRAELFQPFVRVTRLERRLARLGDERSRAGQALFRRRDRAAETGVGGGLHVAEHDHQIVQPQNRMAGFLGDDSPFGVLLPIVGGAGQHDVASLGKDPDIFHPLQAGQHLHFLAGSPAGGGAELHRPLEPSERDHP